MHPALILGGVGAAGLLAYLLGKDDKKPAGAALPQLPPPQPPQAQAQPVFVPQNSPIPQAQPAVMPQMPRPATVPSSGAMPLPPPLPPLGAPPLSQGVLAGALQEIPMGPSGLPAYIDPSLLNLPKLAPAVPAGLKQIEAFPYKARVVTKDAGAAGALTVRASSSTTSPMVGGIAKDSIVDVFEETTVNGAGRARVSGPSFPSGSTTTGWVNSQFLQRVSGGASPAAPLAMPASFNPTFPTPGINPLGGQGLGGLGGMVIPAGYSAVDLPNLIAHANQPGFPLGEDGLPSQPPLPPPPPQAALPAGKVVRVLTDPTGTEAAKGPNATSLRVRSGPSTTAPEVPGGNPADGGGFAKGQSVTITGPMVGAFAPVVGVGRKGNTLTGWSGAAYLG